MSIQLKFQEVRYCIDMYSHFLQHLSIYFAAHGVSATVVVKITASYAALNVAL